MLQAPRRLAEFCRFNRFPLLWYFVATSFVVIAAVSVGLAYFLGGRDESRFVDMAEESASSDAHHILQLFHWNIVSGLDQEVLDKPQTMLMDAIKPKLDTFTRMTTYGLNVTGITVFDLQGNLIHTTSEAASITGAEREEAHEAIRGKPESTLFRDKEIIDLDGNRRILHVVRTYLPIADTPPDSANTGNILGVLRITRDVSDQLALAKTNAFRDAIIVSATTGGIIFVILFLVMFRADRAIAAGIKQQRLQREEVEGANSQLEQRNEELIKSQRELAVARDEATAATRAKSDFLANTSHELRTPLNAIIGYSEMLQEQAEDLDQDDFTPDLKKINSAGKHLLQLINEVLDLSKIEAGKMDLYLESFNIYQMVNDVVALTQPMVEKNANAFEVHCDESLGTMSADMTKLRQGLFNLLSNASKFTERGTISLEVTRASVDGTDRVSFSVSDTGIGMTPEQLQNLFQPFSQASASTSREYGGTGLGLSLSRNFLQLMGGDITAESVAGEGSIFTMTLPAQVEGPESRLDAVTGLRSDSAPEGAPKVLVIDDDPVAQDILFRSLSKEGFRVECASNGEEGIRLARELHPDVITLDVLMPGMDGWAVLSALKDAPDLSDIPVVMVTIVEDQNMGYMLGATEYVVKPVDRERLVSVLRKFRKDGEARSALIVDDDSGARKRLRRILEKEDWVVGEARNGRVALEQMEKSKPDLVLLDLMMPEMNGFEFVDRLIAREEWRTIPVVVLTAKDLDDQERRRLNGYVDGIVQKGSHGGEELLTEIHRVVTASVRKGDTRNS